MTRWTLAEQMAPGIDATLVVEPPMSGMRRAGLYLVMAPTAQALADVSPWTFRSGAWWCGSTS